MTADEIRVLTNRLCHLVAVEGPVLDREGKLESRFGALPKDRSPRTERTIGVARKLLHAFYEEERATLTTGLTTR